MKKHSRFDLRRGEQGASLVELALLLPFFVLLLLGAVDFGQAYYLSMEIAGAAQAGAAYGALNPSDISGIQQAAVADAQNVPGLTVTATVIDECSDGSLAPNATSTQCTAAGTAPQVCLVSVTVKATYTTLFPWPGIPSSIPFAAQAAMRSVDGCPS